MASIHCIKLSEVRDDHLEQHYPYISHDFFNIELEFRYVSARNLETTLGTFNQSVIHRRDLLLSEEFGPNIVFSLFAITGASQEFLRTVVVPDILSFASEVDGDPFNYGRKVIKLIVEVIVKVTGNGVDQEVADDDEVARAIDESLSSTLNFKPASSSSIRALKRAKWGGGDEGRLPLKKRRRLRQGSRSTEDCTICFDKFSDGDEVASMPCGHVYHDGCIVKWLETSHLCPLCRYQMPS